MPEQLSFQGFAATRTEPGSVFLALRPDDEAAIRVSTSVEELRRRFGLKGRLLGADLFHVTQIYLGEHERLSRSTIDAVCRVAGSIVLPSFDITFDRVMSFSGRSARRPVVLFGSDGVVALKAFRQTLALAMQKAGFIRGIEKSYTPHMTVLYDTHRVEEQSFGPLTWTVRDFYLVRSVVGQGRHVVLGRWPLRAESDKQ